MMFYMKMAIQSVLSNKKKFIHNIAGIAIGVMLLVLIVCLSSAFKDELYSQMKIADDKIITVAVGNKENTLSYTYLPVFDQKSLDIVTQEPNIERCTGVKGANVTSVYYKNVEGKTKRIISSVVYSSNQEFLDLYGAKVREGMFCSKGDEVTIGASVAKTYDISIGDLIDIDYLGKKHRFKVSGIIDFMMSMGYSSTPDMINNIILISEKSSIFKDSMYISIVAEVTDVSFLEQESQQITDLLNSKINMTQELLATDMDAIVVNNLAILNMINGYFKYVNMFIIILFVIVSLIVVLNFSNLMTITVINRKKEIGIMKIIGGSNSQISKFYSIECLFTGIMGSAVGLVLGVLLSYIITNVFNWKFELSLIACLFTIIVGTISPTVAGLFTQRKIKKQTISDIFIK